MSYYIYQSINTNQPIPIMIIYILPKRPDIVNAITRPISSAEGPVDFFGREVQGRIVGRSPVRLGMPTGPSA
jgi:hypothetical protein